MNDLIEKTISLDFLSAIIINYNLFFFFLLCLSTQRGVAITTGFLSMHYIRGFFRFVTDFLFDILLKKVSKRREFRMIFFLKLVHLKCGGAPQHLHCTLPNPPFSLPLSPYGYLPLVWWTQTVHYQHLHLDLKQSQPQCTALSLFLWGRYAVVWCTKSSPTYCLGMVCLCLSQHSGMDL